MNRISRKFFPAARASKAVRPADRPRQTVKKSIFQKARRNRIAVARARVAHATRIYSLKDDDSAYTVQSAAKNRLSAKASLDDIIGQLPSKEAPSLHPDGQDSTLHAVPRSKSGINQPFDRRPSNTRVPIPQPSDQPVREPEPETKPNATPWQTPAEDIIDTSSKRVRSALERLIQEHPHLLEAISRALGKGVSAHGVLKTLWFSRDGRDWLREEHRLIGEHSQFEGVVWKLIQLVHEEHAENPDKPNVLAAFSVLGGEANRFRGRWLRESRYPERLELHAEPAIRRFLPEQDLASQSAYELLGLLAQTPQADRDGGKSEFDRATEALLRLAEREHREHLSPYSVAEARRLIRQQGDIPESGALPRPAPRARLIRLSGFGNYRTLVPESDDFTESPVPELKLFSGSHGSLFASPSVFQARRFQWLKPDLQLNGRPLAPTGTVRLFDGDLIRAGGQTYLVHLPSAHPVVKAYWGLPVYRQMDFLEALEGESDYAGYIRQLSGLARETEEEANQVLSGLKLLASLPRDLDFQDRVRDEMRRLVRQACEKGYAPEKYPLVRERMNPLWSAEEREWQGARAFLALADQVPKIAPVVVTAGGKDAFIHLIDAIRDSGFESIAGFKTDKLLEQIRRIAQKQDRNSERLPRLIRDKVDEIRNAHSGLMEIPLPLIMGPELESFARKIQGHRARIAARNARFHEPEEIGELLGQVLDRGKAPSFLNQGIADPTGSGDYFPLTGNLPDQARRHMAWVVSQAERLFPQEMKLKGDREARYRLAMATLNYYRGLPPVVQAGEWEVSRLQAVAQKFLGVQADDFAELQALLRREVNALTPAARRMLAQASDEQKALVLEACLDPASPQNFPDLERVYTLAAFLGKAGQYRPVEMNYRVRANAIESVLSLGELAPGASEHDNRFIGVATRPLPFINQGAPGSVKLRISRNGAPPEIISREEVLRFKEEAERYWRAGYPALLESTLFYDAGTRVYRNIGITDSHMGAKVAIQLSRAGKAQAVHVEYAFWQPSIQSPLQDPQQNSGSESVTFTETQTSRLFPGLDIPDEK